MGSYYYGNYGYSYGVTGAVTGIAVTIYVIGAIMGILQFIAGWRILSKAGEPGWKYLIPFYNTYTLFKIVWNKSRFWIMLLLILVPLPIVLILVGIYSSTGWWIFIVFGVLIMLATGVSFLIISIRWLGYLSKSFGLGTAFTVGLLLLGPIFFLILGFGKYEYIGNAYEKKINGSNQNMINNNMMNNTGMNNPQ